MPTELRVEGQRLDEIGVLLRAHYADEIYHLTNLTGGSTPESAHLVLHFSRKEEVPGGFRMDLQVMEDVDLLTRFKQKGSYKFITESCLYTSMRRFVEEGYLKCLVEDTIHVSNPQGKTRKRWTQNVQNKG